MNAPFINVEPNWAPLERAVLAAGQPLRVCGDWMYMFEGPAGVHNYKHCDTRRYARLSDRMSDAAAALEVSTAAGEYLSHLEDRS